MRYEVVFDARDAGFQHWPLLPGALFAFCLGIMFFRSVRGPSSIADTVFRYFTLTLPLIVAPAMIYIAFHERSSLTSALDDGTATFVSGRVERFHPGNAKRAETFTLAGTTFCYQDAVINGGFHHTSLEGGPLREGLQVRIWHVDRRIARLEIGR